MICAGYVALTGEKIGYTQHLSLKSQKKRTLSRMNMRIWENYCKDAGEVWYKIAEWIEVTEILLSFGLF
jgi:hypothetical protein